LGKRNVGGGEGKREREREKERSNKIRDEKRSTDNTETNGIIRE
jgi:hypothetical protein